MKTKIITTLALSSLFLTSCKDDPVVYEYKCFSVTISNKEVLKPNGFPSMQGDWEIFSIQADKVPAFDSKTGFTDDARCFIVLRRPVKS